MNSYYDIDLMDNGSDLALDMWIELAEECGIIDQYRLDAYDYDDVASYDELEWAC